ncbi:MAG: hypothetical protein LBH21_03110 [Gracilibacteraceae bacterium]|jgi:predicted RNA-binding Zn-ribbon protein involved in translation (DUF1610 family)|nr:hypothetical protein [Gracilibacteraceae bacterium]
MSDVLDYKCPSCGAPLVFDSGSQHMSCGHCGSEFETAALQEYENSKFGDADCEWEGYGSGDWQAEEKENLRLAVCPSCGGELFGEAVTIAAECPYCDNVMILRESLEGPLRPDIVIPFQVNKEAAVEALKKFYRRKPLLPGLFREQNRLERVKGIYAPFWLFDCDVSARIAYKATRVSRRSDARYNYVTTKHYHVLRAGDVGFAKVPVDGSVKLDDALMESLEPYDYGLAQSFSPAYLSGFLADRYDVDAAESGKRANERVKNSARALFDDTVRNNGYSDFHMESLNIRLKRGAIRYALLPVWLLHTKYKEKDYFFAMNGQTGKFVGRLPIAWGKFWGWFFGLFLGLSGAGAFIVWLMEGGL